MPNLRDSRAIVSINLASSKKATCSCLVRNYFPLSYLGQSSTGVEVGRFERFLFLFLALFCQAFCFCFLGQ